MTWRPLVNVQRAVMDMTDEAAELVMLPREDATLILHVLESIEDVSAREAGAIENLRDLLAGQ